MSDLRNKIINSIAKGVQNNELNNNDLVEIIQECGDYLNLRTISDYAKSENISYNGAKKCRENIKIFNVKFIIDNL